MYRGLHCYQGAIQHVRGCEDRKNAVLTQSVKRAKKVDAFLRQRGIESSIITGGGTGTFEFEVLGGVHTEIQPGSFVLGDTDYADNELSNQSLRFEPAMWIHATVTSVAVRGQFIVDAGSKSVDLVSGPPSLTIQKDNLGFNNQQDPNFVYMTGGDEHGVILCALDTKVKLGETVRMLPRHIDPTCNLQDWVVVFEEGVNRHDVEGWRIFDKAWRVMGRGVGC